MTSLGAAASLPFDNAEKKYTETRDVAGVVVGGVLDELEPPGLGKSDCVGEADDGELEGGQDEDDGREELGVVLFAGRGPDEPHAATVSRPTTTVLSRPDRNSCRTPDRATMTAHLPKVQ